MINIAIIYHDADFDGKLSNEVCRYWLNQLHPNAAIHSYGWDYGRQLPEPLPHLPGYPDERERFWEDYDAIYIVDLSVDELMARPELREKIVWIDHHKSAIEKWDEKFDCKDPFDRPFTGYRIDGVAACRLCWQWFIKVERDFETVPTKADFINRLVDEPTLIRLAGEYDVWDHRDPNGKALQFGLRALDKEDFDSLVLYQFACGPQETVAAIYLSPVIEIGSNIKLYVDKQAYEHSAVCAHTIQWEGLTFCALNIGQPGNSDLLRGGIKPEHDACFAWRWTGCWVLVSLYHAPGHEHHDLSKIAMKYGGGGHKGACGFRITLEELAKILN